MQKALREFFRQTSVTNIMDRYNFFSCTVV